MRLHPQAETALGARLHKAADPHTETALGARPHEAADPQAETALGTRLHEAAGGGSSCKRFKLRVNCTKCCGPWLSLAAASRGTQEFRRWLSGALLEAYHNERDTHCSASAHNLVHQSRVQQLSNKATGGWTRGGYVLGLQTWNVPKP